MKCDWKYFVKKAEVNANSSVGQMGSMKPIMENAPKALMPFIRELPVDEIERLPPINVNPDQGDLDLAKAIMSDVYGSSMISKYFGDSFEQVHPELKDKIMGSVLPFTLKHPLLTKDLIKWFKNISGSKYRADPKSSEGKASLAAFNTEFPRLVDMGYLNDNVRNTIYSGITNAYDRLSKDMQDEHGKKMLTWEDLKNRYLEAGNGDSISYAVDGSPVVHRTTTGSLWNKKTIDTPVYLKKNPSGVVSGGMRDQYVRK